MTKPTFEMREGGASAPTQLKRTEISAELRALIWNNLFETLTTTDNYGSRYLRTRGKSVLKAKHIRRDHRPADEYTDSYKVNFGNLKAEFYSAKFPEFYGLVEWFLREIRDDDFSKYIENCLKASRAPYRVLEGDTLVPVATEEEFAALTSAVRASAAAKLLGATTHLKAASSAASDGRWADSIRESIHAVEATAVQLEPSAKELGPALNKLEQKGLIHGGLKNGFKAIYGYTSDERGVRHSLYDNDSANVDEADALFMLGACASFVSYLIAKGRSAGLLE